MENQGAVVAHHAREYETIYILRPNAGDEAAEKVSGRIVEIFEKLSSKLVEVDVWGRRRLAYKIKGHAKGVFIYLRYVGYPGVVEELERNLRMFDAVMKYQTVKRDEEVDPSAIEIDPEAIKFQGMEFSEETEEELSLPEPDDDDSDDLDDHRRSSDAPYLDYEDEPLSADDDALSSDDMEEEDD